MYKLVIIDDEPLIREGLKKYLPWEEYGFRIAGEAEDGISGIAVCQETQPDLVITDIRMPGRSGIELIQQLKNGLPETRFVILSGYGEFELAQQAIRAGASDYILKPLQKEPFTQSILLVKNELDRCHQDSLLQKQLTRVFDWNTPLLKNQLIIELIEGRSCESRLEELQFFQIDSDCFQVVLLDYADTETADASQCRITVEPWNAIVNIVNQYLTRNQLHWHWGQTADSHVILCCGCMKNGELQSRLQLLRDEVETATGLLQYASLGKIVNRMEDIPISYQTARENAKSLFYINDAPILESPLAFEPENLIPGYLTPENETLICSAIENGDQQKLNAVLINHAAQILQTGYPEPDRIRELLTEIVLKVFLHFKESSPMTFDLRSAAARIAAIKTYPQSWQFVKDLLLRQCVLFNADKSGDSKKLIKEIKKYMQDNLARDINLNHIAAMFHLNLFYLSHLFKKETGLNFLDYLTSLRIEKAKELLADIHLKIYEIALRVGYEDQRYFSQVFKKYTGYTPKEFRNLRG